MILIDKVGAAFLFTKVLIVNEDRGPHHPRLP